MRIGFVGAGTVGTTLADLFVRAGHEVVLSHKRPPEELADLVTGLGENARAATVEEAVRLADVAVLAIPFSAYRELPSEPFHGKITIDATNYYPERDGAIPEIDEGKITPSELIDAHLGDARLVRTLNCLPMRVLAEGARPRGSLDRLAVPISSDYVEARRVVAQLIDEAGFDPIGAGNLVDGGRLQQVGGQLFLRPLNAQEMLALLGFAGERPPAP